MVSNKGRKSWKLGCSSTTATAKAVSTLSGAKGKNMADNPYLVISEINYYYISSNIYITSHNLIIIQLIMHHWDTFTIILTSWDLARLSYLLFWVFIMPFIFVPHNLHDHVIASYIKFPHWLSIRIISGCSTTHDIFHSHSVVSL